MNGFSLFRRFEQFFPSKGKSVVLYQNDDQVGKSLVLVMMFGRALMTSLYGSRLCLVLQTS